MDSKENEVQIKAVENDNVVEKKKIHPIIGFVLAMILTILVGGIAGSISTINKMEKIYGEEYFNMSLEELETGEKYSEIYKEESIKMTTIVQFVVFLILTIELVVVHSKKIKSDFKKLNKKTILMVVIATIVMILLNFGLSILFDYLGAESNNQDNFYNMISAVLVPTIIYTAILAPIAEEMAFRYSLGTLINNKYVFMIVSSLLFGILHGIGIITILYVVLGFILSFIYIKSDKNIITTIFAHMANNMLVVLLTLL